ncbi:MAG TPA: hypothetical protein VFN27_00160 [Xanthobacteraceae bacterium]|nr:hypothetical protein [Xanthobacteraceae bacterium]
MRGWHVTALARASRDFLIGGILLYGYVYTAYKYGNPYFGRNDFFRYQQIILHPFDLSAVPAPFVLRQIPAIVASAFYRFGFHFDTAAVIDSIGFNDGEKRRFLAMILSNGLAVCLSFTVLAGYLRKKLATDNIINSLALFGIFAGWFYFPSAVIAPVTIGWGWLVSALFAVAFIERSTAIAVLACALALFARETALIFALTMFAALLLVEGDRSRCVVAPILVLATSCLLYLALRIGFTSGYAHQIDPAHIAAQLRSLNFPAHFFIQLIIAQGMPVLLLVFIATKQPRYAAYLLISAVAVAVTALATDVTDVGLLLGESLPFYATIFVLAWNGAFAVRAKESSSAADGGEFASGSSSKFAD